MPSSFTLSRTLILPVSSSILYLGLMSLSYKLVQLSLITPPPPPHKNTRLIFTYQLLLHFSFCHFNSISQKKWTLFSCPHLPFTTNLLQSGFQSLPHHWNCGHAQQCNLCWDIQWTLLNSCRLRPQRLDLGDQSLLLKTLSALLLCIHTDSWFSYCSGRFSPQWSLLIPHPVQPLSWSSLQLDPVPFFSLNTHSNDNIHIPFQVYVKSWYLSSELHTHSQPLTWYVLLDFSQASLT